MYVFLSSLSANQVYVDPSRSLISNGVGFRTRLHGPIFGLVLTALLAVRLGSGVNLAISSPKRPRREPVGAVRGPSTRDLTSDYTSERRCDRSEERRGG